tara:strand:+ start:369 stop:1997 length:1629 start_codon:yes stop_codon:yes gene_type:complete
MNSKQYQKEFGILSSSGVGVIVTRTTEPFRAIDALRSWAFAKDLPFNHWNVKDGWTEQNPLDSPDADPVKDGNVDPYAAMLKVLPTVGGDKEPPKGLYVMHAIHHWMGKHPAMIECLKQYARDITECSNLRLVIVLPEGFMIPEELKHDIPLLDFDLPDYGERKEILEYITESSYPQNETPEPFFGEPQRKSLIASASGLTTMEIETAYAKAVTLQRDNFSNMDFDKFNKTVLVAKTEVVKNSEVLEIMDAIPMDEVGGLEVYKEWIETASRCFTEEAEKAGVDKPKGVVVIGSPGTGKSLVAKATASVLNQALVKFDISKVYGSLVGQSEERARSAIKMLEAMAPCVCLVDEIDKGLGGSHSSGGDSGVSTRVLGTILTALQESKADIFWIASANRVDSLPPELLRKGRFDEVFAVLAPNRVERKAILEIHLKKRGQKVKLKGLQVAVDASKGYMGAEIEAAVKEAVKVAYVDDVTMNGDLIAKQLGMMKPLRDAFPEEILAMETWAQNNARLASSSIEEEPVGIVVGKDKPVRKRRRSLK